MSRQRSPANARLAAARFACGGEEYAVFAWPLHTLEAWSGLTAAEREVAGMMLNGLSNREIAGRRGRSVRTVANQVAAIFVKLGVRSRGELAAVALAARREFR